MNTACAAHGPVMMWPAGPQFQDHILSNAFHSRYYYYNLVKIITLNHSYQVQGPLKICDLNFLKLECMDNIFMIARTTNTIFQEDHFS